MRIHWLTLILVAICVTNAIAQEPGPKAAEPPAPLPEYVLEVTRPEGCLVSPIEPKRKFACLVYALPRPAKVAPDTSGKPITSKVQVWAFQEGEQWRIRVAVGTGEFFDAGDHKVGDFTLNANERTTVPDVSKFGLSPIRVGVMKIVRQTIGPPQFNNLADSISLESMETLSLPDPFKLSLKNKSTQDLIAVQYNTFGQRGFIELKWLSPGLLVPLIKADETYKLVVRSEDNTCGDGEGYRPNQLRKIDLVSAVFADGTYEGEPALAALIKGTALGNRKNLEHVVQTIGYAEDPGQLAQQLLHLQAGMNEEVETYLIEQLVGMFPMLTADARDTLINYIRSGMHEVKSNLQRDAQHLRAITRHNNPQINKRALEDIKAKYARWWAAAQNMTSH